MSALHARRRPAGRIAYTDGRYVRHSDASVHIEDRGLQFADSIYEVCAVLSGRLMDEEGHLDRLERSLAALDMAMPMGRGPLRLVMRETIRRNRLANGLLYLQVTRGAHKRDHPMPTNATTTLIMTARPTNIAAIDSRRAKGVAVVTMQDIRWGRCDIKSTALLPNILAKTEARRKGAFEAWLIDKDGKITEGASTNAWIVTKDGVLVTRDLSTSILAGVTRRSLMAALAKAGANAIEERAFTPAEAFAAREAFVTSASGGVIPVVSIDGRAISDGKPGDMTRRMHALYSEFAAGTARS